MDNIRRKYESRGGINYRRLVEGAPEVVMVLGPDLEVRYASPAVKRILGLDPSEVADKPCSAYLHPEDNAWAWDAFARSGRSGTGQPSYDLRMRHADGSWRWFEAVAADLLDDPGIEGLAVYLHDVTDRRRLKDQLAHRAFHDPLTGLPNRALFEDRLEHALARAERCRGSVTVLFVDLDDFKAVNDGFGHEVGDMLLLAAGRRLEATLRPGDTVARLGGDEFAVLLEEGEEPMGATRAMERLARALKEPVRVGGRTLFVTSCIGGVTGEPATNGAADLIQKADAAMYRAKRAGKDRFELFDRGAPEDVPGHIWNECDLEAALERGEIGVHFQPEVTLGSGRIVGMEALLRWGCPRSEQVSPTEIVTLAEVSGLIGVVGRQVLEKACRQGAIWQRRYPEDPPLVSVNLSAKQLRQPGLADDVAAALRSSGLDPTNLALEAGEGFAVEDAPHVTLMVEKLRTLGVRLGADDFGRGRSSLSYLVRFPVDFLKIGRSLVGQLGRGRDDTDKLVRALIGFGRTMGIRTVASGVETAEQAASLQQMGCEQAQGFFFLEPAPADAATRLLDSDRWTAQTPSHDRGVAARSAN